MRIRRISILAALAGLGVVFAAAPSQAGLTTFCDGVASDVTIPGDVVVRAAGSCDLTNATVTGNAIVRADANLLLENVTIGGDLVVRGNGFAIVVDSSVSGVTRLNGSNGVYSENTEHGGNVNANNPEFFFSVGSTHLGNVVSKGAETYLEFARLAKNFTARGDVYSDIYDTVVEGRVTITGAEEGSFICASEIDGLVRLIGNSDIVQIGGFGAQCDYNVFGGNLVISDNAAEQIVVDGGVIRGNLVCRDNVADPVVVNNRIRGADRCAGAVATAANTLSRSAQVDAEDRKAGVMAKIEKRTQAAEEAADRAGAAFGN